MGLDLPPGEVDEPRGRLRRVDQRCRMARIVGGKGGGAAGRPWAVDADGPVPLEDGPAQQEEAEVVARVVRVEVGEEDLVEAGKQPGPAQLARHAGPAINEEGASSHHDGVGDTSPHGRRERAAGGTEHYELG